MSVVAENDDDAGIRDVLLSYFWLLILCCLEGCGDSLCHELLNGGLVANSSPDTEKYRDCESLGLFVCFV